MPRANVAYVRKTRPASSLKKTLTPSRSEPLTVFVPKF